MRRGLHNEGVVVGVGIAGECVGRCRRQMAPPQAQLHHRQPGEAAEAGGRASMHVPASLDEAFHLMRHFT
eukprot:364340-Chlamydomonas_euryale.AAC.3